RRVERPLLDLERLVRRLTEVPGDAVPVHRLAAQGLEDEDVQRPLEEVQRRVLHVTAIGGGARKPWGSPTSMSYGYARSARPVSVRTVATGSAELPGAAVYRGHRALAAALEAPSPIYRGGFAELIV